MWHVQEVAVIRCTTLINAYLKRKLQTLNWILDKIVTQWKKSIVQLMIKRKQKR